MLSANDNELLTRTGPGTPMGELFRRFWMPVLIAAELPEPDCPPVRVGALGEELVAFRDTNGTVGLIEGRCPHRRAELFWGRNEECGLRCVYHGWKFDVEGNCVDMPSEPPESQFREKVGITAYPTREWGGYVWPTWGRATCPCRTCPSSNGRTSPRATATSPRSCRSATGRSRWRVRSTRPISPSCTCSWGNCRRTRRWPCAT